MPSINPGHYRWPLSITLEKDVLVEVTNLARREQGGNRSQFINNALKEYLRQRQEAATPEELRSAARNREFEL